MQEGEDTAVDLRRFANIVLKRKWLVLATMACSVTLAAIYTMLQTPLYRSTAAVIIDPKAPQVFGNEVQEVVQLGAGNYWSNRAYYNTQLQILTSRSLVRKTVVRLQLHNDPRVLPKSNAARSEAERIDAATDVIRHTISADLSPDSRIVSIHVKHKDPVLCADLANEHLQSYRDNNTSTQRTETDSAAKFLAKEVDLAEKELRLAEEGLYSFKQKNDILTLSLEDTTSILASDIERYNAALNDSKIKRIELESLQRQAKAALKTKEVLESPIFGLVDSTTAATLKEQYIVERQKFVGLRESLGAKHPDLLAQQKKVTMLHGAIEREAKLALSEITKRLQAVRSSEYGFNKELTRLRNQALALGPKVVAYNRLQRKQVAIQEDYRIVLARLRASTLSLKNETNNVRVHDLAQIPTAPVSPRMPLNLAIAVMMSVFLGLGLVFVFEHLDRTIKSGEDSEAAAQAPLLGIIPILHDVPTTPQGMRERDLYVFNQQSSRAAECCRSIRTNLLFSGADKALEVITVSSPNPQEGKTTSTIYLGTTMAQTGQRVLIVDSDMRRPRLHKSMGVSREQGLSTLILGESNYEDCIKTTDIPNLYVLPCGPTPPNPAELLLTDRFKVILEELRGRFDRILLDSPPLQAVADAVLLAKLSDGAIMVAKAGSTRREDLGRCSKMWRDVDAHHIGVILNDIDLSDRKYGYSYYTYGYAEEPTAEGQA